MSINELFNHNNETTTTGTRGLPGTAELTTVASAEAHRIVKAMEADIEVYTPRIQRSAVDSKELEAIIEEFKPFAELPEDHILRNLRDEQVESMLKSQQSKRSRAKSKAMTLDNYIVLLTAAIAEDILRELYNKPKSAGGFQRSSGVVNYTIEQLEYLSTNQEALKREIRNVQSKKSIMKSKVGFDESDERWQALLKAEQQLKDMRVSGATQVVEVDHTKDALQEALAGVDLKHIKADDARALLARLAGLAANDEVVDDATAEEIQ